MFKLIVLLATLSLLGGFSTRDFEVTGTGGGEKRNVSDPEQDEGDIASNNYDTAMRALKAALASRNTKTIRSGLTSPIFSVRIASAKALGDLCDTDGWNVLSDWNARALACKRSALRTLSVMISRRSGAN